tara:strand:- start:221 stop:535 length:315 start_codon:yes stop_codon:yes gene_type:complete
MKNKRNKGFRVEPEVIVKRRAPSKLSRNIKSGSTAWHILNYVCSEPDEWTIKEIAQDMLGRERTYIQERTSLKSCGYLVNGTRSGQSYKLLPTLAGIYAFERAD